MLALFLSSSDEVRPFLGSEGFRTYQSIRKNGIATGVFGFPNGRQNPTLMMSWPLPVDLRLFYDSAKRALMGVQSRRIPEYSFVALGVETPWNH